MDYVNGQISLEDAKERFRQNDLQLAKKQRTWFKRNESIQWLPTEDKYTGAVDLLTTVLNKTTG
jgi:tRNA A37 N6-isopentenylltransferase MiaA